MSLSHLINFNSHSEGCVSLLMSMIDHFSFWELHEFQVGLDFYLAVNTLSHESSVPLWRYSKSSDFLRLIWSDKTKDTISSPPKRIEKFCPPLSTITQNLRTTDPKKISRYLAETKQESVQRAICRSKNSKGFCNIEIL